MSNMLEVLKRANGDTEILKRAHDTIERQAADILQCDITHFGGISNVATL